MKPSCRRGDAGRTPTLNGTQVRWLLAAGHGPDLPGGSQEEGRSDRLGGFDAAAAEGLAVDARQGLGACAAATGRRMPRSAGPVAGSESCATLRPRHGHGCGVQVLSRVSGDDVCITSSLAWQNSNLQVCRAGHKRCQSPAPDSKLRRCRYVTFITLA